MKTYTAYAAIFSIVLLLGGCATSSDKDTNSPGISHTARDSLDWAGSYRGVLPCADCEGIETLVTLTDDSRFRSQSNYLGKGDGTIFSEQGTFTWNAEGNTVTFAGREPAKYFVAENQLIRLALDGSRITGALAGNYILIKVRAGVPRRGS